MAQSAEEPEFDAWVWTGADKLDSPSTPNIDFSMFPSHWALFILGVFPGEIRRINPPTPKGCSLNGNTSLGFRQCQDACHTCLFFFPLHQNVFLDTPSPLERGVLPQNYGVTFFIMGRLRVQVVMLFSQLHEPESITCKPDARLLCFGVLKLGGGRVVNNRE